MISEIGSALPVNSEMITLDIKTMANNLVYASTIYNRELLKTKIKQVDLEVFTSLTSIIDSSDDHFILLDMYKIFFFCAEKVLAVSYDGS